MYIPKVNLVKDQKEIIQFIRANNFATVISYDQERPIATHIPIEVNMDGSDIILRGHLAKANPQWKTFDNNHNILISFMEAHTYISSSWYKKIDVPTWNYIAVHAYGKPRIFLEEELLAFVTYQLNKYESASEHPVKVEHIDSNTMKRNLRGIVGFEIKVEDLQARFKLSQNKPDQTFKNVIKELEKRVDENSNKIAKAMKNLDK